MTRRLGDVCGLYLARLADADRRIWVLDGDLADSDGSARFFERHPDRFCMAGIAEQNMVSMAAGMASCGARPFVFSFAAFLCFRAYDQIRTSVCQGRQPVVLVGSHSGGCSGRNGKTHTALNDIAVMTTLPHMQVWSPACADDAALALQHLLAGQEPGYVRLPRGPVPGLPGDAAPIRWLGPEGGDIALASSGFGTHLALRAQAELANSGVNVGVLHCNAVWPTAPAMIEALRRTRHLIVVEDHVVVGGLAGVVRHAAPHLRVDVIGWPMDWSGASGADDALLESEGLTVDRISRAFLSARAVR